MSIIDATVPLDTALVSAIDNDIRDLKAAIETWMNVEHSFVTGDDWNITHKFPSSSIENANNLVVDVANQKVTFKEASGDVEYAGAEDLPVGTKVLFCDLPGEADSFWTITSLEDYAVIIVNDGDGGDVAGSAVFFGHQHSHSVSTEAPVHTHSLVTTHTNTVSTPVQDSIQGGGSSSAVGDDEHSHEAGGELSVSNSTLTHSHGGFTQFKTFDPYYANCFVGERVL